MEPWCEDDGPEEEEVLGLLTALLLRYILPIDNIIFRVIIFTALTIAIVMLKLLEVAEIARYNS